MVKIVNGERVPETQADIDQQSIDAQPKPLVELKAESIAEIRRQHALELDKLDLDNSDLNVIHTQNEKNTWAKQQEWAERYLQNPDDLDAKNKLEGMLTDNEIMVLTASELPLAATMAHNILTEADKKEKLLIKANKMRRTAEEAIHSATSHEQLDAIKAQLKAAKDAAEAEFIETQQTP